MLTPRIFEYMQRQVDRRREAREKRRAEMESKRPVWASAVGFIDEHRADLDSANQEIEAVEALHKKTMAGLNQRQSEIRRSIIEAESAEKLLVEWAPDFLTKPLRRLEGRLEAARSSATEPEPGQSSLVMSTDSAGDRERFARLKAAHRERVEMALGRIADLEPVVDQLKALALEPSPSQESVQKILDQYERQQQTR